MQEPFPDKPDAVTMTETLIDKYPYFQTAHALLLKFMNEQEDWNFDRQMRSSSFVISDGNTLRKLIERENNSQDRERNRYFFADFLKKSEEKDDATEEKTDYDIDEASRVSDTDNEDVASETLAKIYIRQGNYEKAIKIYRQLCLKMPKKSSYFASQIENIKNEIKK